MFEGICTNCGRNVQITPDGEFCSACGENLRSLIPPAEISQYFYDRASNLAETQSIQAALDEVQRGLEHVVSSELQLLAAILAESEGEYDLMRYYVSRIPVSDRLRDEGEWLLRSHQARQSSQRLESQRRDSQRIGSQQVLRRDGIGRPVAGYDQLPDDNSRSMRTRRIRQLVSNNQILGPTAAPDGEMPINILALGRGSRRLWPAGVALVAFLGVMWFGLQIFSGRTSNEQQAGNSPGTSGEIVPNSVQVPQDGTQNNAVQNNPAPQVQEPANEPPAAPDTPAPAPEDVPNENVPTDSIDNSVVDNESGSQPVVGLEGNAVEAGVSRPYDLSGFLRQSGRPDLAAFPIDAVLQNNLLVISGAVDLTQQRQEVIELAGTTSDLVRISANELVVRQPNTYVVEADDTLWLIAYKLYGNGERWNDIYEANKDVMNSPDALVVGQQLRVPQGR